MHDRLSGRHLSKGFMRKWNVLTLEISQYHDAMRLFIHKVNENGKGMEDTRFHVIRTQIHRPESKTRAFSLNKET